MPGLDEYRKQSVDKKPGGYIFAALRRPQVKLIGPRKVVDKGSESG